MDHLDRARAESFGALAERYERTRPSYPPELIAWLTREGPGRAVDVGCGTGRVGVLLAAAGWKVVGVEPDARMAAIARSHGLEVDVTTFEQWRPPRADFDLIVSGTAWHWIDPAIGYDRAAALLRSGGALAIFRNSYRYTGEVAAIIERNVRRHAPDLGGCVPLGTADPRRSRAHGADLERRSDLFAGTERRSFTHSRVATVEEWIGELTTHSPVMLLEPVVSQRLLDHLERDIVSEAGGAVQMFHETHCLLATRR